jgi:ribosomal protein S18 acetylase RimI-like enzyme
LSFSSDRLGIDLLKSVLQRSDWRTLVAEIQGELCGYCLLKIDKAKPSAYLHELAVAPEKRRRGLARLLLRAAESEAAEAGRRLLRLDFRLDNPGAKALYEGAGYRLLKIRPAHYQDGASAIRMDKRIAGREFGKIGRLVEKAVFAAADMIRR